MPFTDRQKMQEADSRLRLQTAIRLRWVAVVGQLLAVAFVYFGLGYDLPFGFCLAAIALSAWLNVFLRIRFTARHGLNSGVATALLTYDILQLALLLYLTGGVENPFVFLIVAPVTVSAASLPPRSTFILGLTAAAATALLIRFHLPLPWMPAGGFQLPTLYKAGILSSVLAGMLFLAVYAWRLSKESRQMSAALAATEQVLAREQKLHALDGLAAAAAHELGTPLGTIAIVAKELERELPKGSPHAEDVALLRSQAMRCRDILQMLSQKPKDRDPMHGSLSVTHLLRESADPHQVFDKKISISAMPDDTAAGPARIEPVGERRPGVIFGIGNIIENAVDFAKTAVDVSAHWNEQDVRVTIADDGPGFPHDVMEQLGEPYLTTRPSTARSRNGESSGLGLGFFIAKTLLERSGGSVTFANRAPPLTGAIVEIHWTREAFIGDVSLDFEPPDSPRRVPAPA